MPRTFSGYQIGRPKHRISGIQLHAVLNTYIGFIFEITVEKTLEPFRNIMNINSEVRELIQISL